METTSDNQVKQNQKKKSSKKESHVDHENTDDSSLSSAMMKSIASVLQEIVNESEAEASANKSGQPSKEEKSSASFWAKKPPSISILGYFERIVKYSHIEDSTIIISLIFIDRLCEISNIQLNKHNIHR